MNFLKKYWTQVFVFCFGFLCGTALAHTTMTIIKLSVVGLVGVVIIAIALLVQKIRSKKNEIHRTDLDTID